RVARAYRPETLVLETTFTCAAGELVLCDAMPLGGERSRIVRRARCTRGRVGLALELIVRFDYGAIVPWVRKCGEGIIALGGPDALRVFSDLPLRAEHFTHVAAAELRAGDELSFEAAWFPAHEVAPEQRTSAHALERSEATWRAWANACGYRGPYRDAVVRSLLTLRALTYVPTGGIVAAPTTSLPEALGGVRNWDYRYCWLRDATFTLEALLGAGYHAAARDWRSWLLRAVAGDPADLQILYGIRGERRIAESELGWLAGYEGSKPVRIGNAAHGQFQLDVYGEVVDLLDAAHRAGIAATPDEHALMRAIVETVVKRWQQPDQSLWEMRGPPRHFVHSKVMAWVALDRGVKAIEEFGAEGPLERWREVRDRIHAEVCERGYDTARGSFVQSYGSKALDASALLFPIVGFLPGSDPRIVATLAAIERELVEGDLVKRYASDAQGGDGLPPGEGSFLACSFWLVGCQMLAGQTQQARERFERLLLLRNELGLLAEEYDPRARRQLGNFPQAFSHVGLVNVALALARPGEAALVRGDGEGNPAQR
ncbi:MAG: glycoside hydrolase family 15 protein, partial [Vulcanimicrobiaceae bacterium]